MASPIHLPNELWLLIIPHCPPSDLWRSVRLVNLQLKDCVDQFFEREVLPHLVVSLPVALPTYDIGNPVRGQAIFQTVSPKSGPEIERLHVHLARTEPDHYLTHFLDRWQGMQDSMSGNLGQHVKFDMQLADRTVRMRLQDCRALHLDACGEYGDITSTLFSFEIVLNRINRHVRSPEEANNATFFTGRDTLRGDLSSILSNSGRTVGELQTIVRKYNTLNTDHKSNWQRIRFGCKNLQSLQVRLSRDLDLISTLLLDVVLESIDLVRQDVSNISSTIKGGLPVALENMVENRTADNKTINSAFTTYEHDSKEVWRELRREMVKLGFKSEDVVANRAALLAFARSIAGDCDADEPPEQQASEPLASFEQQPAGSGELKDSIADNYSDNIVHSEQQPRQAEAQDSPTFEESLKPKPPRTEKRSIPQTIPNTPPPSPPRTPKPRSRHRNAWYSYDGEQHPSAKFEDSARLPDESQAYDGPSSSPEVQPRTKSQYMTLTYEPISLKEQSPMLVHLCLPLGWTVTVLPKTFKVSFQDLLAGDDEPMFFTLPPMVWREDNIDHSGWTSHCSKSGRLVWRSIEQDLANTSHIRYTHPSMPDEEPHFRCLTKEWGHTHADTKHSLEDIHGCYRVCGDWFVDFTIENPCQVLQWTTQVEEANPGLLMRLREWAALPQPQ